MFEQGFYAVMPGSSRASKDRKILRLVQAGAALYMHHLGADVHGI
jgi:putative NIF3 family GTP cyclohydrolase 1 type 2